VLLSVVNTSEPESKRFPNRFRCSAHATGLAVKHPIPEFPLQVDLHPQEFQSEHLRLESDGVI
jgi:hypothetical protein